MYIHCTIRTVYYINSALYLQLLMVTINLTNCSKFGTPLNKERPHDHMIMYYITKNKDTSKHLYNCINKVFEQSLVCIMNATMNPTELFACIYVMN